MPVVCVLQHGTLVEQDSPLIVGSLAAKGDGVSILSKSE